MANAEENEIEKIKIGSTIKLDSYAVLSKYIDDAIEYGWNRAHKHTDTPDRFSIIENIHDSIMNELSQILRFD